MAEANSSVPVNPGFRYVRGLREVGLLATSTVSLFLFIALSTFSLEDSGWTRSGSNTGIHNAGGMVGAWVSDLSLSLFGIMAFLFPLLFTYYGVVLFRNRLQKHNAFVVLIRFIGFSLVLASGASLSYLHFLRLKFNLPGTSGGILGQEIGDVLLTQFGSTGSTLILLAAFLGGITLFTGLSWLMIIDSIGQLTINVSQSFVAFFKRDKSVAPPVEKTRKPPVVSKPERKSSGLKILSRSNDEKKVKRVEPSNRGQKESQLPLFETDGSQLPPISLLSDYPNKVQGYSKTVLEKMSRELEKFLDDFGVDAEVVEVHPGPVITRFEIQPAAGVKISRISTLSKDLARVLSVSAVRVVDVIPGKSVIGLEVPNEDREMVSLKEVLSSPVYDKNNSPVTLVLGKDISGQPVVADLAKMPHLLVAGTTGSGKSVAVNAMIMSILYKSTPEAVRMIMIDPKMLELSVYEGIPHLLTPVVTDMKEAANALRWSVAEMERRYRLMSILKVKNLVSFNQKILEARKQGEPIKDPMFDPSSQIEGIDPVEAPELETMPIIVIVIDELADMMMIVGKKVEELIARLAQKARAAGLHLILATQRPSVDVLTGLIKANVPTRIAFQVSSKIDSRTILDQGGAETLLGNGDMLYLPPGTAVPNRAHGAFVDDLEVHRVVDYLKSTGTANYIEEITMDQGDGMGGGFDDDGSGGETDPLFDEAVKFVTETRRASISGVQRKLKVGYNRAARMVEDMERAGIVSSPESNGMREVLAPPPVED